MFVRLVLAGILELVLLCLPAVLQATPLAVESSSTTLDISGVTISFGPGTENWHIEESGGFVTSRVLVDQQIAGGVGSTQASLSVSDELGRRGGETSLNHGQISSSAFAETVDLHSGTKSSAQAGTRVATSFYVSGEGHGILTISVPYTLDITRTAGSVVDHNGVSVPIDMGVARVDFSHDATLSEATLFSAGKDDSLLHLEQQGTLTWSREFLNPVRSFVSLDFDAGASTGSVSLPEPSSVLFLASALIACACYSVLGKIKHAL